MITEAQIEAAEVRVSGWSRAIAKKRSVAVGLVAGLLVIAVSRGWVTPGVSDQVRDWVSGGFDALTTIGAGYWIHRGTTPADQKLGPVNSEGQKLIPDPSAAQAMDDYTTSGGAGAAFDVLVAADTVGGHAAPDQTAAQPDPAAMGGQATTTPAPTNPAGGIQ